MSRPLVCLAMLCCIFFPLAHAAETTFTVTTSGSTRTVSVESVYIQGIPHVPLCDLAGKVGGDCRVRPSQVQIDFRGVTALADLDGLRIFSSRKAFSLRHPIVRQDDVVYVELLDTQTLFREAFQVTLTPSLAAQVQEDAEPPDPPGRETREAPPATASEEGFEDFAPFEESDVRAPESAAPESVAPKLIEPLDNPPGREDGKTHIVIDPGHGGRDTGSVGARGTAEKDVGLRFALALQDALSGEAGFQVHLTRTEDKESSIKARAAFANVQRGAVLLSLHAAASPSESAHGIGIYYPPDRSASDAVLNGLRRGDSMSRLEAEQRRSAESRRYAEAIAGGLGTQVSTEGIVMRAVPLRLSAFAMMPVVLVEAGYLSNPAEAALLATDAYLAKLAAGIAEGVKAAANAGRAGR